MTSRGVLAWHVVSERLVLTLVLLRQPDEEEHHDRNEQDDDPRADRAMRRLELDDRDDDADDRGQRGAYAVDEHAATPPFFFLADVVACHARLRQRERREDAQRIERNQVINLGAGDDEQEDHADEAFPLPLVGDVHVIRGRTRRPAS